MFGDIGWFGVIRLWRDKLLLDVFNSWVCDGVCSGCVQVFGIGGTLVFKNEGIVGSVDVWFLKSLMYC